MPTFLVQTLGCKVNHYESEQIATLLRQRGWNEAAGPEADLRIVNTCSITQEAASKSRQSIRRASREVGLPGRVLVTGCWATSDPESAARLPGVGAVLTHHEDIAARLDRFLAGLGFAPNSKSANLDADYWTPKGDKSSKIPGTYSLPTLNQRQTVHQRAFLKIQDGCDAHCSYCIIPNLRPILWSKSPADVLEEARRMVAAGHLEIVLTGIFLGAFGQSTALRRRQTRGQANPLAELIRTLCTNLPGLRRIRLSSLEPGDLTDDLLQTLRSHEQVVPHFHLPLQSGSNAILRRMNRQYTRDDYLKMLDRLFAVYDRPALTTDILVGFPGETDAEFEQTLDVVRRTRFLHIHAFPFSPRPGTAAARWKDQFVPPSVSAPRMDMLQNMANQFSLDFRRAFLGQTVNILVERPHDSDDSLRHGRCERYFDVHFPADSKIQTGDLVTVRIDRVAPNRTFGTRI